MNPRQRKTLERLRRVCENAWQSEAHWVAHEAVYQTYVELEHLLDDDALGASSESPIGERSRAEAAG